MGYERKKYCCSYWRRQPGCEHRWKDSADRTVPNGSWRCHMACQQDFTGRLYYTTTRLPDGFLAPITKHGQWQAGHPWESYLESRTHPFWKKTFEKKGESSMKTHTGISSALPFQQFPFGSIFFLLLLFFSLWCLPNARHHLAFMKVKQKVSSY